MDSIARRLLSLLLVAGCDSTPREPDQENAPSSAEGRPATAANRDSPTKPAPRPSFSLDDKKVCEKDSDCVLSALQTEDGPLFCCHTCPGTLSYNKTHEEAWTQYCEQRPNPPACPSVKCMDDTVRRADCWGGSPGKPGICSFQEQSADGEWLPKR